jgi:hypothetical protein
MAKGKRAAALFEVIQAAKEREQLRAKGGGFLTPSWWFKGQKKANGEPATPQPSPARSETPAEKAPAIIPAPIMPETEDVADSVDSAAHVDEETNIPEHQTEESLSATFTPEPPKPPVYRDFVDNEEPAMEDPSPAPVLRPVASSAFSKATKSPIGARQPIDVAVDHGKQQIVLRLSFTSAAITTFALIVVVALIVLITKSMSHGPSSADASSIDAIKNGKPTPGVLSVFQGKGSDEMPIDTMPAPKQVQQPKAPTPTPGKSTPTKQGDQSKETAQANSGKGTPNTQQQSSAPAGTAKRIIGQQYVLIQSYPDPEDANDARDALVKAGIDCTVEKGTRWATRWSCVIGTRGFDHTRNNPEFKEYMKSIEDVSNSFAGQSKFRKFEPQVIGWRE